MIKRILYPSAYIIPYEPVDIGEAVKGRIHYCFGCHQEMVLKRGLIRRPHFAHKPPFNYCDSDDALHETAKANICKGFLHAVEVRQAYNLSYPCSKCRLPILANVADAGATIASEKSVVPGTRSDLVVTKDDGITPRVIIEIVVTHNLEPDTRQKYEDSDVPVVKVRPTWEDVATLTEAATGCEALNVQTTLCKDCRIIDAKNQREAEQRQLEHERRQAEAREIVAGITPQPGNLPHLTSVTHDRYGSPLKAFTRNRIMGNARKLVALGFKQQPTRPTLFLLQDEGRKVYADLDSTEVMRIWEVDCVPAIYSFPLQGGRGCRECVLELVEDCLAEYGIHCRRHFEDRVGHEHD